MIPASVIRHLESQLLAQKFDSEKILHEIMDISGLDPKEASRVLYFSIRNINSAMFPPLTKMELFLTELCNLRCAYCFEKGIRKQKSMDLEIARKAVDNLLAYSGDEKELSITFFGGEPCLRFSEIQEITEYANERASERGKTIRYGMTSNGTLFTAEMLEFFAEKKINVLLSIDGLAETHDLYRRDTQGEATSGRVLEGMRMLKQYQPWIGAKMTIMPETAVRLFDNVKGLYQAGVNQFIIGAASGVAWSEESISAYCDNMVRIRNWYSENTSGDLRINELDEKPSSKSYFGCQAGRNSISVSVDGEISGCSKVLSLDNNNLVSRLGDVRWGLCNLKNRLEMVQCRKLKENCKDLGIDKDFKGGCFACNYEYKGDIYYPNLDLEEFHRRLDSALQQEMT